MLKVHYWVANPINNEPLLVEYPVSTDVRTWPTHKNALVYLTVDLPQEVLDFLVEYASFEGWGFNPHTRCFYRL
jgi:hypothetical protein